MPELDSTQETALRERAYYIWEREGRPKGRAEAHWRRAVVELRERATRDDDYLHDEEKIIAGRPDVNYPALLTKDVPGG